MTILFRLIFAILLPIAAVVNLIGYVVTKQNYYLIFFILNAVCAAHNFIYFNQHDDKDGSDDDAK
jgi:hypothetical protein